MKTMNAPKMEYLFFTVFSFPCFPHACNGVRMIFQGFTWFRKGSQVQINGSGWFPMVSNVSVWFQ